MEILATELGKWLGAFAAISPLLGYVLFLIWKGPKTLDDSETSES